VVYKQIVTNDVTGMSLLYKLQYRGIAALFSKKNALNYRLIVTKLTHVVAHAETVKSMTFNVPLIGGVVQRKSCYVLPID
jgi:hypothetical protein